MLKCNECKTIPVLDEKGKKIGLCDITINNDNSVVGSLSLPMDNIKNDTGFSIGYSSSDISKKHKREEIIYARMLDYQKNGDDAFLNFDELIKNKVALEKEKKVLYQCID